MSNSFHANRIDTLRFSAGRFELSPYAECYATPETIHGAYAGRYYPMSNGEDPIENYWNLRRKAVLYDVPEKPLQIEGPDVVPFLEHIFSRPISNLAEDRGRYAIACTPSGGIFMDGILFRLGDKRFWYVQAEGAFETWLIAFSRGFDISISDPKSRVLQIQGPKSMEVMSAASSGLIDENMGYFHAGFFDLGGQQLYVSRTGWTGELGFEIYSQGDKTDYRRLWDHLIAAGEPHGMVVDSLGSMNIRRIEAAILDNGVDMDASMTPYEAGLGAFVDLDKTDFIGREALLGADRSRRLYGLKSEATPDENYPVFDGDHAVGYLTTGAWSPYLQCGIGYVRFDAPGDWVGRKLSMDTGDTRHACEIVELPFYDPEKRIPRGLDHFADS